MTDCTMDVSLTPAAPSSTEPASGTGRGGNRFVILLLWVALLWALGYFLGAVRPILLPFVMGFFIAYLTDPLAQWMGRRKVNRTTASAIITLSFFTLMTIFGIWLLPMLYHQAVDLMLHAPQLVRKAELAARSEVAPFLESLHNMAAQQRGDQAETAIPSNVGELVQRVLGAIGGVVSKMVASAASLLNLVGMMLLTPVVSFYLIRDWPAVLAGMDRLLPRQSAPVIREQLRLINHTLAAYVRGQVMVMVILSVFYCSIFAVMGLENGVLLGLLAGCVIIIPYVGSLISIALGLAMAYGQFGMDATWWGIVAVYGVGQMLETQVLTPKIVGEQVGLHPLWLLFGMLAGGALLGFVGVLLAVPLTAVISVLARFAIGRYLASPLYHV